MGNFILFQINGYLNPMNYYDLVSRGTNTSGSNQCYGTYSSSTGIASGGGYTNSCIHSGANEYTSGTAWYNYALASAGTITGTSNTTNTAQSICPKGWTLPSTTQMNTIGSIAGGTGPETGSNTYIPEFSPVLGGHYANGSSYYEATIGLWWGSTASTDHDRYCLYYNGSILYTDWAGRYFGRYIRCVSSS